MDLQIISGEFGSKDALDILTQIIRVKIKYHENKITNESSEEDIKFRESKVRYLQNLLFEVKNTMNNKGGETVKLDGIIAIA